VTCLSLEEGWPVRQWRSNSVGSAFRSNSLRVRFPKEKPCGEGLMPSGVATLERLGLNGSKGAPFNGICYHFGERIAEGRFPKGDGLPCLGRGFRRLHLDHALFELARRTPNVKVHTGALVEAPLVKDGRVVGLMVDGTLVLPSRLLAAE
jgi:2-polyprenyl-6-methoxyphenol hydroxylase-like FAD-dependent oxidoreductase